MVIYMLAAITAPEWILIISAIGVVVVNIITAWRSQVKIKEVKDATVEQHKVMNSRLDEFKRAMEIAKLAEGELIGRAKLQAEIDAKKVAAIPVERSVTTHAGTRKTEVGVQPASADAPTVVVKVEESDGTPIPPDRKLQAGDTAEVDVDDGKKVIVHEDEAGERARE